MCDYSMQHVASRPAKTGDCLVTKSFAITTTRGFADVEQRHIAVCLLPGTEVAFDDEVQWYGPWRWFGRREHVGKLARFCQINLDKRHAHHDALEFPNGRVILLTQLREGQRARVLQLPPASRGLRRYVAPENEPGPVIDVVPTRVDPWLSY